MDLRAEAVRAFVGWAYEVHIERGWHTPEELADDLEVPAELRGEVIAEIAEFQNSQ